MNKVLCSLAFLLSSQLAAEGLSMMKKSWVLNTSNQGKLNEFQALFAKQGASLSASGTDLKEIDADPISVVVHKASQIGEEIVVEDTSLDIEGADVGVNVRWLLDHLSTYAGRKAHWKVLLAYRKGADVYVYEGKVDGTIVLPQGEGGFGFDPVFLPDGESLTLAEAKPDRVNARAIAVTALLQDQPIAILPLITDWKGGWQHD
jgi:XTP/dITP diphosphohydrolase